MPTPRGYIGQRYATMFNLVKRGLSTEEAARVLRTRKADNGQPYQISTKLARQIAREGRAARKPLRTPQRSYPRLTPTVYTSTRGSYRYEGTGHYRFYSCLLYTSPSPRDS